MANPLRATGRLRVGMVLDTFPAVSETFLHHQLAALLEAGHDVTIFATRASPGPVHEIVSERAMLERTRFLRRQHWGPHQLWQAPASLLAQAGMHGVCHSINGLRYGTGAFRLRALHALSDFHEAHFDILHCHYASIGWAFLPYRDIFRVPLVTSFHGDHYKSFGRKGRHLRALFLQGDAFIANSEFTAGELAGMGCPKDRIHRIPAPVADRGVRFRPRTGGSLGPTGKVRLLCVARMDRSKGLHILIEAARQLLRAGNNIELILVGDGPHRRQFEEQCSRLDLCNAVHFQGWRSQREVYAEYDRADLFVLPSIGDPRSGSSEAQGVVLQEAMLHGVPVVASDLGGIPESLNYGAVGTLCPPNDPALLTACIVDTIRRSEQTLSKVIAAEAYVRAKYLPATNLHAHEVVYRKVLAGYWGLPTVAALSHQRAEI